MKLTRKQQHIVIRVAVGTALLIPAMIAEHLLPDLPMYLLLLLYLPAYLAAGAEVLWSAVRGLFHGDLFDENFLMCVATVGALALGFIPGGEPEFHEAVFVMLFYRVGSLFESIAVGKSRRSISALMSIRPVMARVVRDGVATEVSPEEVAVGEEILIRAGECVPLDGRVKEGESNLDTKALTGEALPRAVAVGDAIYSGCTNMDGVLTVTVEKPFADSTVSRVLSLMQTASEKKARSERFITRFARYYTPSVVLAAVLLATIPPIFWGHFSVWLGRALTFLVVSCPCALVISVPLAFFGGMGGASRFGVLVKGSGDLEALADISTAVFDKTGTVTTGDFAVMDCIPADSLALSPEGLLTLAAVAECESNHPLSRAICERAGENIPHPAAVKEIAGRGVVATTKEGAELAVGNAALMADLHIVPPAVPSQFTAVYVAENGAFRGVVLLSDQIKENAKEALAEMKDCGVKETVMLTGDRPEVAADVAAKLGIRRYHASLFPADKVDVFEKILAEPHEGKVAFVGDGINDAPVLARADVGIAMGALGADAAIEAADVVLMDDNTARIPRAIRHARKVRRIVRENIAFALGVKGAVLLTAAIGLLGSWQMPLAIFADVGVAVIAILNAMRTLRL